MTYFWSNLTVLCLLNFILEATDGMVMPRPSNRACVIGAGYSGLATARYLKQYGLDFTVYEASRHVGGTWRFDPHVGIDEDGLPLFTSQYKLLRTNTPRQTMEFAGFPFPEGTPSYPTGTCFYRYLKKFVQEFDFMKNIRLQSYVTSVKWAGRSWNITYTDTATRTNHTDTCDFVVVANGGYCVPVIPKFEGLEQFRGNMIHSHDYKDPETFRNRRVLLVGAGASGLDLATHLSPVASKLYHSHHLKYNQPNFSSAYVKKPDIHKFTTSGVVFQDGSVEEVDDVILCTGYDFKHDFLDENVGITHSGKFVLPLYQQMVNIRHPSMVFVGVSKKIINRVLDAQGEYAALLAAGKFSLPSQELMLKQWLIHVYSLQSQRMKIVDVNVVGDMDQYFANLTSESGVVRAPPVLTAIRDFNAKNRLEDLLNYRDYDYQVTSDYNYTRFYNKRPELPCPISED